MSTQAVHRFLDRVTEDPELKQQVQDSYQQDDGDRVESTVKLASGLGFEFSSGEFFDALEERYSGSGELEEGQLEQVAGGVSLVDIQKRSLVHKGRNGVTIVFPEVCKTPGPGGPVPIPYPNTGMPNKR